MRGLTVLRFRGMLYTYTEPLPHRVTAACRNQGMKTEA